jgi:tetratricopeptide (TPR) repeat protein
LEKLKMSQAIALRGSWSIPFGALGLRPNFPEALLNLSHALKTQGRAEEARFCWRQALEMKPELAQGYFGG